MKIETKKRMKLACLNASELIRNHAEVGLSPKDVNEITEEGVKEYGKACHKIANYLEKLAMKYETK